MSPSTPADVDAVAHVFVDALTDACVVEGTDGHHLAQVRRLRVGERVTAADNTGAWRVYEVADVERSRLRLAGCDAVRFEPAPPVTVALAVAPAKGGLDDVVAAVSELGAARIIPVRTARTVVRWDDARAARAISRLRIVAREAAMQCRRARAAFVDDFADLDDVAARDALVVADRTGCRAFELTPPRSGEWTVLVGPEGGLAPEELERLADRPRVRLADHVLRAVTAPIAAVAILTDRIAQKGHP